MNHFMLPDGVSGDQPARYGVHAMELLINEIMKLGGERSRLRAKVFGAANVIRMERSTVDVGRDNAEFVRRFLATERIPIDGEKLGGTRPLEVRMETATGRIRARELGADTLGDLIDAERTRQSTRWRAPARPADLSDVLF
jgi:chemotaxis receptor (MCP) glutamine deamidase CheD